MDLVPPSRTRSPHRWTEGSAAAHPRAGEASVGGAISRTLFDVSCFLLGRISLPHRGDEMRTRSPHRWTEGFPPLVLSRVRRASAEIDIPQISNPSLDQVWQG